MDCSSGALGSSTCSEAAFLEGYRWLVTRVVLPCVAVAALGAIVLGLSG